MVTERRHDVLVLCVVSHIFCLLDILHGAGHMFHRRVWHRALSLRYACIRRSGIILYP